MTNYDIVYQYFKDPNMTANDLYCNGGVVVYGYGFIGSGYGGGIDQDQAHRLMYLDGYLNGLGHGNHGKMIELMKALNGMVKEIDSTIPDDKLPFINLE